MRCQCNIGEAFVGTLGTKNGLNVLDLGCGGGTTAPPAAKLGANMCALEARPTYNYLPLMETNTSSRCQLLGSLNES